MSLIKTPQEIQIMRDGGKILSDTIAFVVSLVRPGATLVELDNSARNKIESLGAKPSFLHYRSSKFDKPFPSTLCLSVNEEVVHGCGNRNIELKEGDIVGIDVGCWFKGMCTDMAVTVPVGAVSAESSNLISVTRSACLKAVDALKVDGSIADVGRAVEAVVLPHGYGIVRSLVGHGVGHDVHEQPEVPNYYNPKSERQKLAEGMCLAIEPMITAGDYNVETLSDGWSVATADRSLAAHFEVTVAINKNGAEILTPLPV
jgi:methionyl aminopeptidase